ncbi:MAG: BA14K family protein [Shinella sp.]|nr:BA14K family protein [Shinella sp.]
MKKLAILALSLMTAISGVSPSFAFPSAVVPVAHSSNIEFAQAREGTNEWRNRNRAIRRDIRRDRDRNWDRRSWRGHRGYRYSRPGYRRHSDGWWYPLAAFGAGAIVGGALSGGSASGGGNSHTQWCANRYRSYRAYDNTFQPYNGPRQRCVSPY